MTDGGHYLKVQMQKDRLFSGNIRLAVVFFKMLLLVWSLFGSFCVFKKKRKKKDKINSQRRSFVYVFFTSPLSLTLTLNALHRLFEIICLFFTHACLRINLVFVAYFILLTFYLKSLLQAAVCLSSWLLLLCGVFMSHGNNGESHAEKQFFIVRNYRKYR